MMVKIFIDGEHGTTGLQIYDRLKARQDINLLSLPHENRHNLALRVDCLRAADLAILCLPDDASRQAVEWLDGYNTRIIDASTAFRTDPGWVYGFAEMTRGQKRRIASARRLANPGCYPTGAIALLRPLREAGVLGEDYPVSINAISGYSGGGKQLIAQMEEDAHPDAIRANHFLYALQLNHKHVAEIAHHGLLNHRPIFTPNVGRFTQGMMVNLPLHQRFLIKNVQLRDIHDILSAHYEGQNHVEVAPLETSQSVPRLEAETLANCDQMQLYVCGQDEAGLINLVAVFDNLGKGAAGAAVQNLELMLGCGT